MSGKMKERESNVFICITYYSLFMIPDPDISAQNRNLGSVSHSLLSAQKLAVYMSYPTFC